MNRDMDDLLEELVDSIRKLSDRVDELEKQEKNKFSTATIDPGPVIIDQETADDTILGLRSTGDVSHGITNYAGTSEYGNFRKVAGDDGGLNIGGFTEQKIGMYLFPVYTVSDTGKTTSAYAPILIDVYKKSGAGVTTPGTTDNLFAVRGFGSNKFLIDQFGSVYIFGGILFLDSGQPMHFTSIGTGSYNKTVIYHDASNGLYFDIARLTDSISATPVQFAIGPRGGNPTFLITPTQEVEVKHNFTAKGGIYNVTNSEDPILRMGDGQANTKEMYMYVDRGNDLTVLQAVHQNVAWTPLTLNPNGGEVYSVAWQDYGPYSTILGWSALDEYKIYYMRIGNFVFVHFSIDGTSDSGSTSFTVPHAKDYSIYAMNTPFSAFNNGAWDTAPGLLQMIQGSTTVTLIRLNGSASWTASGRKLVRGQFFYHLG